MPYKDGHRGNRNYQVTVRVVVRYEKVMLIRATNRVEARTKGELNIGEFKVRDWKAIVAGCEAVFIKEGL